MHSQLFNDVGYNNTFWMKISENKVLGAGDLCGVITSPEEVEAWVYNEFSKEAAQIGAEVIDFRINSRVICLQQLKTEINKQIRLLQEDLHYTNAKTIKKNKKYSKSIKPKSS